MTRANKIPTLHATTESVEHYQSWIARELATGNMTATVARELTQAARTMVQVIRTQSGLDEMATLRDMLKRAEAAAGLRRENEISKRYNLGTELGEFSTSDTEPEDSNDG